jgi:hypothetical protein
LTGACLPSALSMKERMCLGFIVERGGDSFVSRRRSVADVAQW